MQDNSNTTNRVSGLWLATGATLLIAALVFHGPPDPDNGIQMHHVAEGEMRWALVHWTAAAALFLLSGAGFMRLVSAISDNTNGLNIGAWCVMALGALLTVSTAVGEAAVVSAAAKAEDLQTFASWWAFTGGMANGFMAMAIAVAVLAIGQTRASEPHFPVWASYAGAVFGLLSAIGWSLDNHLAVAAGGPIWLISTVAMCAWLVWFGITGQRSGQTAVAAQTS